MLKQHMNNIINVSDRREIPFSYAYYDFIGEKDQHSLLSWATSISKELKRNQSSPGRYFAMFSELSTVPDVVYSIKKSIESLIDKPFLYDTNFTDFLSFNMRSASIHPHKDPNLDGYTHTRFNLLISVPESGGNPIYNGTEFKIQERMLWRCEAGKYEHASTPVIGTKPRINISFGFQIKND